MLCFYYSYILLIFLLVQNSLFQLLPSLQWNEKHCGILADSGEHHVQLDFGINWCTVVPDHCNVKKTVWNLVQIPKHR